MSALDTTRAAPPYETVPAREHPSNLDPTSVMVEGFRSPDWTVFKVSGGFTLLVRGRAVKGLFNSQQEAVAAVPDVLASVRDRAITNQENA